MVAPPRNTRGGSWKGYQTHAPVVLGAENEVCEKNGYGGRCECDDRCSEREEAKRIVGARREEAGEHEVELNERCAWNTRGQISL